MTGVREVVKEKDYVVVEGMSREEEESKSVAEEQNEFSQLMVEESWMNLNNLH